MPSDPQILTTLTARRDVIEATIAQYEAKLHQARQDLIHVNATMELFASDRDPGEVVAYMDMNRVFRRGEVVTLCKAALAAEGELDTRELALRVMAAKGFDSGDNVLRKRIAYRIVQALSIALKRRTIGSVGKRNNVRVWRLPRHRMVAERECAGGRVAPGWTNRIRLRILASKVKWERCHVTRFCEQQGTRERMLG